MNRIEELISENPDFEPSIATKRYWRKTRKMRRLYGNIWLPGLFNTNENEIDRLMLKIIVVLEAIGFVFLSSAANWGPEIFWGFFIAIILDFACVLWSHAKTGSLCENQNYIAIYEFEKDFGKAKKLRVENFKIKMLTTFPAHLIIIFIGFIKIWFYLEIKNGLGVVIPGTHQFDVRVFGVVIVYAIICALHIKYSGFAIHEILFRKKLELEFREFQTKKHDHQINGFPITRRFSEYQINSYRTYILEPQALQTHSVTKLKTIESRSGVHNVSFEAINNSYMINTWSILSDSDLFLLAQQTQSSNNEREFLAIYGLKHQLNIMSSSPKWI